MSVVPHVMVRRTVKPFFRPSRPSAELKLGHRSLYIIPSRFGVLWIAAAGLLLLVAIQTGSNSTLLLAFVMLGLMVLAMFLTHDTLQGLTLRCDQPSPVFAGEPAASGADRDHRSTGTVHLLGALAAPPAPVDLAAPSAWPRC